MASVTWTCSTNDIPAAEWRKRGNDQFVSLDRSMRESCVGRTFVGPSGLIGLGPRASET